MSDEHGPNVGDASATDEAGDGMHFHRPKPLHGVREILTEIGVIVVGIVIALVGEQAVEALHWRHKVDEAEQAMRNELALDDGPQAYARVAVSRCFDEQLRAIINSVEAGRDRSEVAGLGEAYQPPLRTWDRGAWDAAVASDIGSHVGADRLTEWGRVFTLMDMLNAQAARETEGIDLLTGGSAAKGPLSSEEADRTLQAAKSLRRANSELSAVSLQMLLWLRPIDAQPTQRQQAEILADARRRFGACVVVPDPSRAYRNSGEYSPNSELVVQK